MELSLELSLPQVHALKLTRFPELGQSQKVQGILPPLQNTQEADPRPVQESPPEAPVEVQRRLSTNCQRRPHQNPEGHDRGLRQRTVSAPEGRNRQDDRDGWPGEQASCDGSLAEGKLVLNLSQRQQLQAHNRRISHQILVIDPLPSIFSSLMPTFLSQPCTISKSHFRGSAFRPIFLKKTFGLV